MLALECDIPCLPVVGFKNVWRASPRVPLHPVILNEQFRKRLRNSRKVLRRIRTKSPEVFNREHRIEREMQPNDKST